jgi:hypothetical protein
MQFVVSEDCCRNFDDGSNNSRHSMNDLPTPADEDLPKPYATADELPDPVAADALATEEYKRTLNKKHNPYRAKTFFGKYVGNPVMNTLPGLGIENLTHTTAFMKDDPNFTFKKWNALFEAAKKKGLSEEYYHYFENVGSEQQFKERLELALTRQHRRQQIGESYASIGADFLAGA